MEPFSEVITGWKTDAGFRAFFNELPAQAPYAAFSWETPPVRQATAAAPFGCVLVDSKHLAGTPADPTPLRAHFEAGKPVVGFVRYLRQLKDAENVPTIEKRNWRNNL